MIASDTYGAVEGGGRWKSFIIVSPLESKAKTNFKTGRSGFNTIFESYLFIIFNKIYFMDDDETTDFQLEAFNETDVINDHPDSPDEVDRTAFSSLAETEEDPESIKIDYVNDNTGRLGTHDSKILAQIHSSHQKRNHQCVAKQLI